MSKENIFKRWPWLAHVLAMIGVSLVILVIVFSIIKLYARQGQEYELPDVVGMNIAELQADNPTELDVVVMELVSHPTAVQCAAFHSSPPAAIAVAHFHRRLSYVQKFVSLAYADELLYGAAQP